MNFLLIYEKFGIQTRFTTTPFDEFIACIGDFQDRSPVSIDLIFNLNYQGYDNTNSIRDELSKIFLGILHKEFTLCIII